MKYCGDFLKRQPAKSKYLWPPWYASPVHSLHFFSIKFFGYRPQIRRQDSRCLLLNMRWNFAIERLGNTPRYAGQGVAVAPQRNGIADGVFV